ncbi:MAG: hypothetical protein JEZ12_08785 [Desulfobacterium sp.]|nr:hypothetical protein [Desulfobacterium sp.]
MHQDILNSLEKCHQDTTGRIEAVFRFDPCLALFAGHFPGAPMLPGVVQIEMVRSLVERAENRPLEINHIKKTKFLKPIVPGDQITVEIESCVKADGTSVTARLSVGDVTAGTLRMTLGPTEMTLGPVEMTLGPKGSSEGGPMTAYPDVLDLIPHRPPFVMIDHILEITSDTIVAEKTFSENDYGTRDRFVLEGILIEAAAQSVAAKQGYDHLDGQGDSGRGMLVSVGNLDFFSKAKASTPLGILVEKQTQVGNFKILTVSISQDKAAVAKGTIQLFVEP